MDCVKIAEIADTVAEIKRWMFKGVILMSRIVVLVGSMRKGGNTDLLAQAFVEGANKNNSVEVVSVADNRVNPCIGCNSC